MDIVLYEHGCPKCRVLKEKLKQKNIEYTDINDIELMKQKGFTEAPQLEVDGILMNFSTAINWIKEQENNGNEY